LRAILCFVDHPDDEGVKAEVGEEVQALCADHPLYEG